MLYPDITYKIRKVVFDIYNNVGPGYNEDAYEEMLADGLYADGLSVIRQKEFEVLYKGNRVGSYRTDLIINDIIVVELKAVPEVYPLHKAQIISYLKITQMFLGMLINFGGNQLFIQGFPNKFREEVKNFVINFDINKINLSDDVKKLILPFLLIAKEILETLGPGYFHQVYRRAFWDELKRKDIGFHLLKQANAIYNNKIYQTVEVRFFKIGEMLISVVAIEEINNLVIKKFLNFMKNFQCKRGLLINFNSVVVDFRFLQLQNYKD